mgnify:CR=1 FL=1
MIGYFKISAIGTAHLENPDGVCQDYSDVLKLDNGYTIAVIADGLGSASKSDIGAKVAVNSFLAYINLHIKTKKSDKFYIDLISQAYQEAYNNVMNTAEDMKIDFTDNREKLLNIIDEDYKKLILTNAKIKVYKSVITEKEVEQIIKENKISENIDNVIWYLYSKMVIQF